MKSWRITLALVLTLLCAQPVQPAKAALQFAPTTNVMIITVYDSFDQGVAGNGHFCWDETALMLSNPTNMYRNRYASQSGKANLDFLTNNMPAAAMPLAGSMHGTNDVWFWLGTSGNSGNTSSSNYYFTNITGELQFPMMSWTKDARITNDWPWTTNNLHWTVFSDSTYLGTTNANAATPWFYSAVASNAAIAMGVPFIDSSFHTIFECAVYATNFNVASNLFYPVNVPPDFIQASHPQKRAMQGARHIGDLIQMGLDTNVWSCYGDWNAAAITATNNCSVGTVSKTANTISFPIRLNRSGPPVETADGFHTNDMTDTFTFVPAYSNAFHELLVISNMPPGTWVSYEGSTPVLTNTITAAGVLSNNYYHVYSGAWYWQKMAVLNTTRKVRDINTNDASTTSGQVYMRNFGSFAGIAFPTNAGVANYTAFMQPQETTMEAVDIEGFNAAQPFTQTFSIQPATPTATVSTSALTNAINTPVVLDGTGSANATTYFWKQTNGSPVLDLIGQDRAKPMILSATNAGAYTFQLIVGNNGLFATNAITITFVNPVGRTNYVDNLLSANTTTYSIVSRNGSGTDGNGYTNIQYAADHALPGDVIFIRAGVYTNVPVNGNQNLVNMTNSGSVTNPIIFKNYNGELVTLAGWGFSDADANSDGLADGPAYPALTQTMFLLNTNANYIQVSGLTVTNSEGSGITVEGNWCYVSEIDCQNNWMTGVGLNRSKSCTNLMEGDVVRWCKVNNSRHFTGILIGLEDQNTVGFARDCAVADCLSYGNGYTPDGTRVLPWAADVEGGGNSGGFWTTKYFADNAVAFPTNNLRNFGLNLYFMRSIAFSNCDDGFAFDHAGSLIEDNRSLYNGPTGARGYKFLRSLQDFICRGDVAYGNLNRGFEVREDSNTVYQFYNNSSVYNGDVGFWLTGADSSSMFIGTNNVSAFNHLTDWNPTTQLYNWSKDGTNTAYHGDPLLANTNVVLALAYGGGWTVKQKHDYLEAQLRAALLPATNSPLIHAGIFVNGYFTPTSDTDLTQPALATDLGRHWASPTPDFGAFDTITSLNVLRYLPFHR